MHNEEILDSHSSSIVKSWLLLWEMTAFLHFPASSVFSWVACEQKWCLFSFYILFSFSVISRYLQGPNLSVEPPDGRNLASCITRLKAILEYPYLIIVWEIFIVLIIEFWGLSVIISILTYTDKVVNHWGNTTVIFLKKEKKTC